MNSAPSLDELRIRRQIEQADRVLDGLEAELCTVEGEIDKLADKRHQYDLLERACAALEELDELGAADLFWDIGEGLDDAARHIGYARLQIEAFEENINRIEAEREAVLDRIDGQNETLDYLYYELQELLELEEARRNEWLVERDAADVPYRRQIMPWARGCEEDERFRRSLGVSLAASVAVAFLVSTIALPIAERPTVEELPERVAKLVRQERALPPPPPVVEPPPPEEEIPEPEPEIFEELPDEVTPDTARQPVLADAAETDSKEQVRSKGILAFRDSFANRANLRPMAQLGSQARVSSAGEDAIGMPERRMVATSAPGSSGGINLASISRNVGGGGGGGMEGMQLARVASTIGGGGDGPDRPLAGGSSAGRTDEEIQIVFDRYKAALYRLYNRELRKDPTLRGQMVLKLTIEPDGTVSLCELHSSDMKAPTLAQQVVERVATFDFGAKEDIVAMTIIYPIDFLPAA